MDEFFWNQIDIYSWAIVGEVYVCKYEFSYKTMWIVS